MGAHVCHLDATMRTQDIHKGTIAATEVARNR
jgi:hypothetical protein